MNQYIIDLVDNGAHEFYFNIFCLLICCALLQMIFIGYLANKLSIALGEVDKWKIRYQQKRPRSRREQKRWRRERLEREA